MTENGGGPYPVDAPAAPGADGGFVLPMPLRQSPKNSSSKAKSESSTDGITIEEGSRLSQLLQEELIKMEDLENLNDEDNVLGQGSFGIVRKVRWRMTPAAAKVSHKGMPKQAKALCLRELELMVRCRHPNIVQFLGYVDTPFVIVMELLPAGDLRSYWRKHNMRSPHKVSVCIDVLRALAYLHNRAPSPIVHRDVKPTNVLLTASGIAKLTDFGLARHEVAPDVLSSKYKGSPARAGLTGTVADFGFMPPAARKTTVNVPVVVEEPRSPSPPLPGISPPLKATDGNGDISNPSFEKKASAIVGTVPYSAPEVDGATAYGVKVDIYSAAVTFYELFEQTPFDPTMPFAMAMTPRQCGPLIRKMGQQAPDDRPSAVEMIRQFEATGLARTPGVQHGCCSVS